MPEQMRSVMLRAEIDTNKATYHFRGEDVVEFVEWWNVWAQEHGLPTLTVDQQEPADAV